MKDYELIAALPLHELEGLDRAAKERYWQALVQVLVEHVAKAWIEEHITGPLLKELVSQASPQSGPPSPCSKP